MASPFSFAQVSTSQEQKEAAINALVESVERNFSAVGSKACGAGGTITLSNAEAFAAFCLKLTGAPAAAFNLVVPAVAKLYLIKNDTSPIRTATVKTASGSGVTVTTATAKLVYCDGTNVIAVSV